MRTNKDNLVAYPIVEELGYRSQINSYELNKIIRSVEESVLRSILRGNEANEQLSMLNLAFTSAYNSLYRNNQIYNRYPEPYDIPSGYYGGVSFATAYGYTQGGRQNDLAGLLTLDWDNNKKISKIPVYDGVISRNVELSVDNVTRNYEDKIYNIVDKKSDTFWIESMSTGEHYIELTVPPSTYRKFNYIEINPLPIFGMKIKKVEYYDTQSSLVEIFNNSNTSFNESGPIFLHLQPKEFNNIIRITVDSLSDIGVVGFSSIDVGYIDYLNNTTTCYMKFENIPTGNDHSDNSIDSINPISVDLDFKVDGMIDSSYDSFITEIALVTAPDNETGKVTLKRKPGYQTISASSISIDQNTAVDTDTYDNALYLKIVMKEVNQTTPIFRGCKLNWREI